MDRGEEGGEERRGGRWREERVDVRREVERSGEK